MRLCIALILSCITAIANSTEYAEYPAGISELAYFASDGGWGDPSNQHRFVAFKVSDGQYQTKKGTYVSLRELMRAEDLTNYEGVAIECRECSGYGSGNDLQNELERTLHDSGVENFLVWPSRKWSEARRIFLDRTTGKVIGRITASENGEPLQWAYVSSQYFGGDADESGEFEVDLLDPGLVQLVASRRDREAVTAEVEVIAGETTHHDFVLPLAKPACCELEGEWEIILNLTSDERPDDYKPETVGDTATGRIVFSTRYENPLGNRNFEYSDGIRDEYGEFDIDLTPFFGENITASISNTVFGGSNDPDLLRQVHGSVSHYDKVGMSFIPRMSHGGISLYGQIVDDSEISGEWHKRDYAVMVSGTFVMNRVGQQ